VDCGPAHWLVTRGGPAHPFKLAVGTGNPYAFADPNHGFFSGERTRFQKKEDNLLKKALRFLCFFSNGERQGADR